MQLLVDNRRDSTKKMHGATIRFMTNKIHFKVNGVVCSQNCLQLVSAAVAAIFREIRIRRCKCD